MATITNYLGTCGCLTPSTTIVPTEKICFIKCAYSFTFIILENSQLGIDGSYIFTWNCEPNKLFPP